MKEGLTRYIGDPYMEQISAIWKNHDNVLTRLIPKYLLGPTHLEERKLDHRVNKFKNTEFMLISGEFALYECFCCLENDIKSISGFKDKS